MKLYVIGQPLSTGAGVDKVKDDNFNFYLFDRFITCGYGFVVSTRLSILKTNAAVFPVPDCDCAIMF